MSLTIASILAESAVRHADRTAVDVDSARGAARELAQLSGELTRLIDVFTV